MASPEESTQLDAAVGDNAIAFNVTGTRSLRLSAGLALQRPEAHPLRGPGRRRHVGRNDGLQAQLQHDGWLVGRPLVRQFRLDQWHQHTQLGEQLQVHRRELSKHMFGPYFGAYALKTYNAAKAATSDLTVAP